MRAKAYAPLSILFLAAAALVTVAPAAGPALAADATVAVDDNVFSPSSVTVSVGDTVTWVHQGSQDHTVTADDGSFDSSPGCPPTGCMQNGDTFARTFTTEGTFPYYCKIHGSAGGGGMAGTVVVQAAQASPAPTSPAASATGGGAPPPIPNTGGGAGVAVLGLVLLAAASGLAAFLRRRAA